MVRKAKGQNCGVIFVRFARQDVSASLVEYRDEGLQSVAEATVSVSAAEMSVTEEWIAGQVKWGRDGGDVFEQDSMSRLSVGRFEVQSREGIWRRGKRRSAYGIVAFRTASVTLQCLVRKSRLLSLSAFGQRIEQKRLVFMQETAFFTDCPSSWDHEQDRTFRKGRCDEGRLAR